MHIQTFTQSHTILICKIILKRNSFGAGDEAHWENAYPASMGTFAMIFV